MTSDGGWVVARELDGRCGLTGLIRNQPVCSRAGSDAQFPLADLFGHSASSQLAVYEDLYDGTRLARDPTFHLTMHDSSIGLAKLRLDGFVSLNAGPIRSRIVVTRPFISYGSKLEVIACILLAGSIAAEAGESHDRCSVGIQPSGMRRVHGGTPFDIGSPGREAARSLCFPQRKCLSPRTKLGGSGRSAFTWRRRNYTRSGSLREHCSGIHGDTAWGREPESTRLSLPW